MSTILEVSSKLSDHGQPATNVGAPPSTSTTTTATQHRRR